MNKIDYQKVEKFWDDAAKNRTYSDDIQTGMLSTSKLNAQCRKYSEEKHFDRIIDLRRYMNVLEIGCGTGRWAFYMAPKVKKVVAIDLSANMIEIAKTKQKNENINNIEFYYCSASEFDSDEKFDIVYFSSVLQYISDDDVKALLNKVPKWLNNGGICLSRDTVSLKQRIEWTDDYPVIYRTKDEYIKLFKRNKLYLTYNKKSFNRSICSVASECFLNRFFPNSSLRTLIILERLIRPSDFLLRFIYKKVRKIEWGKALSGDKFSHDFFVYKLKEGT